MFFLLILWLVEPQRYGYKPMLSPQRDPSKGYLSDPCKHYLHNPCMGHKRNPCMGSLPYPQAHSQPPLTSSQHE